MHYAIRKAALFVVMLLMSTQLQATIVTTQNESAFQSAFTNYTLLNMDNATFDPLGPSFQLSDANPLFSLFGIQSVGYNADVISGQAFQLSKPGRDKLIANGHGFGGHIAFDFANNIFGIGALSNLGDYGTIRAYSGTGLSGALLGQVTMSEGGFGGLISTTAIRSFEISCDFNADLKCGVYDMQFSGQAIAVPAPASLILFLVALAGLAFGNTKGRSAAHFV